MTDTPIHMMEFAGMITAVGMGVVFIALMFLSIYMSIFKRFTTKFEQRKTKAAPPAAKPAATAPPVVDKAAASDVGGEKVAAAVAVSLYLDGVVGGPSEEVAAAITTAIALEQSRRSVRITTSAAGGSLGWGTAGRLEAQSRRLALQARGGAKSAA